MNKQIFILAMAAFGFVACSSDETVAVNQNDPDAISFRPLMNNVTRASSVADVTTANLTAFTVNAMQAGTETAYFSNAAYTGTSNGTFTCATKYYWPSTGNLDFYAYAPAGNGQVTYTDYKTFTVTPTAGTDPASQVDLVYAATKGKTKASNSAGVTLNFRHTGAKIVCKVKNTSTTLKFAVEGWKVGYLYPNGTFVFADTNTDGNNTGAGTTLSFNQWTPGGTKAYSVEYASTFSPANIAASASATDLGGEFILVPQRITAATAYANSGTAAAGDKLNNTFIAVKLKIMNNNASSTVIADDGNGNAIWAIWPIGDDGGPTSFNWEPGKKYTYTIDLAGGGYYETNQDANADLDPIISGAEIKFVSVTVDDWNTSNIPIP